MIEKKTEEDNTINFIIIQNHFLPLKVKMTLLSDGMNAALQIALVSCASHSALPFYEKCVSDKLGDVQASYIGNTESHSC